MCRPGGKKPPDSGTLGAGSVENFVWEACFPFIQKLYKMFLMLCLCSSLHLL
jgi:hypothetical protein